MICFLSTRQPTLGDIDPSGLRLRRAACKTQTMVEIARRIRAKLERALQPQELEIVDQSDLHRGHRGYHPKGESHFKVIVVAQAFDRFSTLQRHRQIYSLLAEELAGRVHALSITALTPQERKQQSNPGGHPAGS